MVLHKKNARLIYFTRCVQLCDFSIEVQYKYSDESSFFPSSSCQALLTRAEVPSQSGHPSRNKQVVRTISKSLLCPVKEHSTGAGWNESCWYRESISTDKVSGSNPEPFPLLKRRGSVLTDREVRSHFVAMTTKQETEKFTKLWEATWKRH